MNPSLNQATTELIPLVNLPETLGTTIKTCLENDRNKNLYLVLDYRYGLNRKKTYTLEQIGTLLGVTRERIRQIETKAIRDLKRKLFNIPLVDLDIKVDVLQEISNLKRLLSGTNIYVEEKNLFEIVEQRYQYNVSDKEKANLKLLFELYGFRRVSLYGCRPIWQILNAPFSPKELDSVNRQCRKILLDEVIPVSYVDLLITLAQSSRRKLLDDATIRYILSINESVEMLPDDYYQIHFVRLSSASDMAHRILWQNREKAMHSDDIAKEINQRLVTAGERSISKRTVVGSMSKQSDLFATIGKSGQWGLADWDLVQATIVNLMMRAFHELKRPANMNEIYSYIRQYRPDAKRNSISAYLSDRPEFAQVGWGIYQPSDWKITDEIKEQRKRIRQLWTRERYAETIVQIFDKYHTEEMPLKNLTEELCKITARSANQIIANVLNKTPAIRKVQSEKGNQKNAVLVRDYKFTERITMMERVQKYVRETLLRSPNHSMKLTDLKQATIEATNCHEKTFYQYLSRMPDIIKEPLESNGVNVLLNLSPSTLTSSNTDTIQRVYDIAVSYAGQDYEFTSQFVHLLRKENFKVFFAPHYQAALAGDFLPDELVAIYRDQARKCIIVVSEHYIRSKYTNLERKAALERKLEDEDYAILLRLDDSELKGWLKGDLYLDARQSSVDEIVKVIVKAMSRS